MGTQLLKFPATILMIILGIALGVIFFFFLVVGLFGASLKELFIYLNSAIAARTPMILSGEWRKMARVEMKVQTKEI